jgi:hypothetical protein
MWYHDNAIGMASGYRLDNSGVWGLSPGTGKNFPFSVSVLGSTQPPIQWVWGTLGGIKQQWREADHLPQTSAEIKKMWICSQTYCCNCLDERR